KAICLPLGEYCADISERVEAMSRTGGPAATPEPDSERRQILASNVSRTNASRWPLREITGQEASPPINGSCSGSPTPEVNILQRFGLRKIPEPKMISPPLGVHAGL